MKYIILYILSISLFNSASSAGLAVINPSEEIRWVLDITSASSSASKLMHEFVDQAYLVNEIAEIHSITKETKEMIDNYNIIARSSNSLIGYEADRNRILKEQIESMVQLVRGIKSVIEGIRSGISSRSLSAAVSVMREERERLILKYEMRKSLALEKYKRRKRNEEFLAEMKRKQEILKDYKAEAKKKNNWSLRLF
jgi:hypothetical protein